MANSLNLYATKVFGEQPISLWALDEPVGYLSIIPEAMQNLNVGWTLSGVSSVEDAKTSENIIEKPPAEPFENAFVNGIIEQNTSSGLMSFMTTDPISSSSLNQDLGSFAISLYTFAYDRRVQFRLGYRYTKPGSPDIYETIRLVNVPTNRQWAFVSETFGLPEEFDDIYFVIEVSFTSTEIDYQLVINGIGIGQWSEEFHTRSLGATPTALPASTEISGTGVLAQAYGLQGNPGYYLTDNNALVAVNSGMPLVFGSNNSTEIKPNSNNKPSLILPGEGLFNETAQYQSRTFETWLSIQNNALTARKIFGPLQVDDGIYVEKHLMKLKIGNAIGSYSVGEWDRPMLLNLRITENRASLVLNGQEVISLELDIDSIVYQSSENDWVGFYAYDDVPNIRIEAPAIYPYEVPAIVSKRRFVFGQGVDFPTNIKGLNNSAITYIDYSMANYTKNYSYPQLGLWSDGLGENIIKGTNSLELPQYATPAVIFNNKTEKEWLQDSYDRNELSISLKPNNQWNDTQGYMYFEKFGFLRDDVRAFYGVFDAIETTSFQTLFTLENSANGAVLSVYLENNFLNYKMVGLGQTGVDPFYSVPVSGSRVYAGLDVIASKTVVGSFFGNRQAISVYVGGNKNFTNTFTGSIQSVGFMTARNATKSESFDATTGLPLENNGLDSHIASYTLVPKIFLGFYSLDIATDSYWEGYIPLTYFGSFVKDLQGENYFDLDFLQFNIGYPKFNIFSEGSYDTSNVPVKTYVSFQYLKSGANANYFSFANTQSLSSTGVVRPGSEWPNTKYEVLNDTVIYPPVGVAIGNVAIVIHIDIQSPSASEDNIAIKNMSLSSQALNENANRIKTRFGSSIIPYRRAGLYFDYKNVEPYSIYKQTSPHLYLTSGSGIRQRGSFNNHNRNGLSIPINSNQASFFKVDFFQMMLRFDETGFPTSPVQIFEMQSKDEYIKFFLVADSNTNQRGQVYAIDDNTGTLKSGIVYYINGIPVKRPVLNLSQWTMLGILISPALDFESVTGAIRFTSPLLFNNISYYQTTELDEIQRFGYRKWTSVRSGIDNPLEWAYWSGADYDGDGPYQATEGSTWQEVLFLSESDPVLPDPEDIYKKFTGTSSIVVDTGSVLSVNSTPSSGYSDVVWSTFVTTPV